ncbi:peptidase E [Kamptonema cortianum]|nr:peptidase E [Geitlerinema splendidum]MDK3161009.1 peptidase E [Kamptonema cortianum]
MPIPRIVALGGGGFDSEALERSAIDRYLVDLTGKSQPKICLIPTASGDSIFRVARFLKACAAVDAKPSLLELFRLERDDFVDFLSEQDIVFVSGGNTHNMLALWRLWGLDDALHQVWEHGTILAGVSAGANCWFENCSTDSFPARLEVIPALGWLEGGFCPHFDEEENRRPMTKQFIESGIQTEVLAVDGGVGCVFEGTELKEVFTCHREATAYQITGSPYCERKLDAKLLTI